MTFNCFLIATKQIKCRYFTAKVALIGVLINSSIYLNDYDFYNEPDNRPGTFGLQ
jgi:hypothetical protein